MIDVENSFVFLAGPMTGIRNYNAGAFVDAHALMKEMRAACVYNPAIAWLQEPPCISDEKTHDDYLLQTIGELTKHDELGERMYDLVVMLPGWEKSPGACTERDVALAVGIPVFGLEEVGRHGE